MASEIGVLVVHGMGVQVSPSYGTAVSEDIEINVGGLFTSWNPIFHTEYWTDNDFIKPVAHLIRDVVLANLAGP